MTELHKETILSIGESMRLVELIRRNESVSLIWLPGSGRTHLGNMMQNENFFEGLMSKTELEELIVVYVDQSIYIDYLEAHILGNLSQYGRYASVNEALFDLINKRNHKVIFVIDNFKLDKKFFGYLNSLRSVNTQRVAFIFMILRGDFQSLLDKYKDPTSLIYHNPINIRYFDRSNAKIWLGFLEKRFDVTLSSDQQKQILDFAGGIPLLLENCVRFLANHKEFDNVISSQEMRIILLKLYGLFNKREKKVLVGIVKGNYKFEEDLDLAILKYLEELGLLNGRVLNGGWLRNLLNPSYENSVIIENSRIFINDIDKTNKFSNNEQKVLEMMSNYEIVDREMLGEFLFDSTDEYSDWAIDKFISRLRSKIYRSGGKRNVIKTIRGKGYSLDQ